MELAKIAQILVLLSSAIYLLLFCGMLTDILYLPMKVQHIEGISSFAGPLQGQQTTNVISYAVIANECELRPDNFTLFYSYRFGGVEA